MTIIKVDDWYLQFEKQEAHTVAEPIVIILQTYKRTDCALPTIAAACRHLKYGGDLLWYVADDGSPPEHVEAVVGTLNRCGAQVIGVHNERLLYGGNCNKAWAIAEQVSALTFWLEDDWVLSTDVDLYPYAALLMERDDIGMVRLGYLNTGIRAQAIGHGSHIYWALDHEPAESSQCVFTGHPSLRHRRYHTAYGDYPVIPNPGETELMYAAQYRFKSGPSIVWPVDWPQWGRFEHIGTVKTETML